MMGILQGVIYLRGDGDSTAALALGWPGDFGARSWRMVLPSMKTFLFSALKGVS